MNSRRTTGMTAIGVANVVLGALGVVSALATGLLAGVALVRLLESRRELRSTIDEVPVEGWVSLVTTPLAGILDVLLVVAGIQVLRMKPSAPVLCRVYAVLALPLCLVDFWEFRNAGPWRLLLYPLSCVSPSYSILLVVLFLQPSWRRAFRPEPPLTPSAAASSGTAH